jgi:ribosomal-protein-alanine N-acetyltransferase
LLEGNIVNLRVTEKEDLPLVAEWLNNPEFYGQYFSPIQRTRAEMEKALERGPSEFKQFMIEKKDGTKIGFVYHDLKGGQMEIGYAMLPSERNRGYGTEAIKIIVDYLFLSKQLVRIQATTDVTNEPSQRVLEKNEFKKEGTIRKAGFIRGQWRDEYLYSILREEWKEPKILTKWYS